ncbi:hypothetical protein Ancab_010237 [Ancistrocladus abbreviatus]
METYLDSLINSAGWLAWDGNFALTTLFYGEYKNFGPGSSTSGRVKWGGYKVITSPAEDYGTAKGVNDIQLKPHTGATGRKQMAVFTEDWNRGVGNLKRLRESMICSTSHMLEPLGASEQQYLLKTGEWMEVQERKHGVLIRVQ